MAEALTNISVQEGLLTPEAKGSLENVVACELDRFSELSELKRNGKMDFGQVPEAKDLPAILDKVTPVVDSFLEFDGDIAVPKIEYPGYLGSSQKSQDIRSLVHLSAASILAGGACAAHSSYLASIPLILAGLKGFSLLPHLRQNASSFDPKKNCIAVDRLNEADTVPEVAHEYCHAIIRVLRPEWKRSNGWIMARNGTFEDSKYDCASEGICRGVERHVAEIFGLENSAYLYTVQQRLVEELRSVYSWICKVMDLNAEKDLTRPVEDGTPLDQTDIDRLPSRHALGSTLFRLREEVQGSQVYAASLR